MSAFDYGRPKATSDRLLARYGQSGLLRRLVPGTGPAYDPGEPFVVDEPATFVVTDYSNREIDGARVLATDKKVLLAVVTPLPTPADKLVIGGVEHSIVRVDPLAPGGVSVLITLQCRR